MAAPREDLPLTLGTAGLVGRRQQRPPVDANELESPEAFDEAGEPVWAEPRAPGRAIPAQCLKVLNSPLPPERGGGCINHYGGLCPGTQRDGGCLAEVVRAANLAGAEWLFEVNRHVGDPPEGFWDYCGEPFDG